jgi:gluconate 2-dehydrogenase alpha chain
MSAQTKPHVDAVIVGFGWTGAILAKELIEAGLKVLALERGGYRDTYPDGAYPNTIDELTYNIRKKLFLDLSKTTVSIRHTPSDTALPYRQLAAFLPGEGVGGAGLHWSGVHFRIMPDELRIRSHYEERYGKRFIPEGMTIQDYGVSYEELEPHFDFAEKVFGTSGQAYKVKDKVVGDGNIYEASRSDNFPLPAQLNTYSAERFGKAARELGLHPYRLPSANTSGPYTNPYGVQMGPCNFCGFCSGYACYMYSKACAETVAELRIAFALPRAARRSRRHEKARYGRDLCRSGRQRSVPTGRSGYCRCVPVSQRPSASALGHRQAVRPDLGRRRGGPQLRLPEPVDHHRVLRQAHLHESVHRCGRQWRGRRRLQRRQL